MKMAWGWAAMTGGALVPPVRIVWSSELQAGGGGPAGQAAVAVERSPGQAPSPGDGLACQAGVAL